MKVDLIKEEVHTIDVTYLLAKSEPRYWEDSEVNGVSDEDGTEIPCRVKNIWCPLIHLETGKILNWEIGKTAFIHYKVCDAGTYILMDSLFNPIRQIHGYVPKMMAPVGNGFGDYIIMHIDQNGFIQKWHPSFEEFN